ncbi:cyclin-dependent kinase 20 isoform X15 [Sapajus apella]|uniref:Cyclin-dependent kinase 20 n=1 Tax=Sapajus apella TaxID=9515 RepID=A0A6J3EMB8_SAPAP|nr:cyclin-dependent kinase 20 isoform X15 [Sapajus apella]
MDQYCILGRIGEGAHGIVFKAKHVEPRKELGWHCLPSILQTGEIVALKKVALRRLEDGIPNQALREIKALQEMEDNQYVVQLKAVFPHGAGFVLAFEFMLSDLAEVVRHAQRPLAQAQVKSYLQMLLKGVAFCHANNIVHRGRGLHHGGAVEWVPPFPGSSLSCRTTTRSPLRNRHPCPWRRCCPMPLPRHWTCWVSSSSTLLAGASQPPRLSSISTSSQLLCLPIHLSYLFLSVQGDLPPRPIQAPPHVHDFHVDRPLEESLLNPELIWPFIPEG